MESFSSFECAMHTVQCRTEVQTPFAAGKSENSQNVVIYCMHGVPGLLTAQKSKTFSNKFLVQIFIYLFFCQLFLLFWYLA